MTKLSKSASALAGYLCPLFEKTDPASPVGKALVDWCWQNQNLFGADLGLLLGTLKKGKISRRKRVSDKALPNAAWLKLAALIRACAKQPRNSPVVQNTQVVAKLSGLDRLDADIFALVAMTTAERAFDRLLSRLIATRVFESVDLIALMIGADAGIVAERLANGRLTQLQFVDGVAERPGLYDLYTPYRIMRAVRTPSQKLADIERALLGAPVQSSLEWRDFGHMARERDFAMQLIKGAVEHREKGVNILLYGAPGVGKTELAKTLAHKAGIDLFTVAECDEDGDEPGRYDRLAALRVADRLGQRRGNAVLLFDEMEDVLAGGYLSSRNGRTTRMAGSKVHFNRMLEKNETPVIWTANEVDEFDPALLRRMLFAIKMKTPPASVRADQWMRLAKKSGFSLKKDKARDLGRDHKLAPAFAHAALRAAKNAKSEADDLDFIVSAIARPAISEKKMPRRQSSGAFNMALLNPDCDLAGVEARLRRADSPRDVSFILYGPPGTGKSELAAHIAACMQFEMLEKRASDLLSPWVGETEQNIAAAFEEAASDKKLLLIDEAESLFWSRDGATRNWQVSMVNEFLVGLERSPVPVACTTNFLDRVDPAALRRFTFKVKLDYLNREQTRLAFKAFFDCKAPDQLGGCRALTPGDFAVVKRQLRFCDEKSCSASKIAEMLAAEAAVKQKGTARIGF